MKILFLSGWIPCPANNGSKIRILNLLRGLSEFHEVTLIAFINASDPEPDLSELGSVCQKVVFVPGKTYEPKSLRSLLGFFSPTPRSVLDTYSQEMAARIREELADGSVDLVIAFEIGMAGYYRSFAGTPAILDDLEINVIYQKYARAASLPRKLREGLTWMKLRRHLINILKNVQACTVVSTTDANLVASAVPNSEKIVVIPNFIDIQDYQGIEPLPKTNTMIYTGSFRYFANYDAMDWFLESIFPLIRAAIPDASITITGDHCNMRLPITDHVNLTGYVDDVRPLVASAAVSLVPLRIGGGSRLKILEAMAMKTPVVSTSKGAEGIDAENEEHILIADTPEDFAEAVIKLMNDHQLRSRIVEQAFQFVQQKYERCAVIPEFLKLVQDIAS